MEILSYCSKGTAFLERAAGMLIYLKIFWSPDDNEASCKFFLSHKVLCLSWLFQDNYSPRSKCSFLDLQESSFDLLHARKFSCPASEQFLSSAFSQAMVPKSLLFPMLWLSLNHSFSVFKKERISWSTKQTQSLIKRINNQFNIRTESIITVAL